MLKRLVLFLGFFLIPFTSSFSSVYLSPSISYYYYYLPKSGPNVNNSSYEGLGPQLAIGYSTITNQWIYVAGELFTNIKGFKIQNRSENNATVRVRYSLGASILPGLILDPLLMFYARIGLIYTLFEQNNTMRSGYQLGLGLQYNLSQAWDVKGEYDYMQYNSLRNLGSPRAGEFTIGLVYRFDHLS